MTATTKTGATSAATLPVHITPESAMRELASLREKLAQGAKRLGAFTEDDLAIATTPADEVYREDMVRLYRCRPTEAKQKGIAVLIVYALVGSYKMIDLETDRSFVRTTTRSCSASCAWSAGFPTDRTTPARWCGSGSRTCTRATS